MPKAPVYHPPKKSKGKTSSVDYWNRFKNLHPNVKASRDNIATAAHQKGIDRVVLAAYLLQHGGIGNAAHIEAAALFLSTTRQAYPQDTINYVRQEKGMHAWEATPGSQIKASVVKSAAAAGLRDPVMRVGNKPVVDAIGNPIHKSAFLREWSSLNDTYQYYLGRNASKGEIARILKQGTLSKFQLAKQLSNTPGFYKGYAWRQHADSYKSVWATIYGPGHPAPRDLIKRAIVNNWDQGAFELHARHMPQYQNSLEVKTNMDNLSQTYSQIMGMPPDKQVAAQSKALLLHAALNQWDTTQLAAYLRDPKRNPGYIHSYEQQTLGQQAFSKFGLVFSDTTGQQSQPAADTGGVNG